jgi:hypothetical protein
MKRHLSKRRVAAMTVFASALIATAAFAFFTSTGSGTGGAQTASGPNNITISQVGAGYDSLVPNNGYVQDQCLAGCDGPSEFGNEITLANSGAQQLANVVVAFRNWGPAIASTPITLTIYNTVAGVISDTENPSFPAATVVNANPSVKDVTFDFSSQGAFVDQTTTYGISFGDPTGTASSLNVALSNSSTQLSVGSDAQPGYVWLATSFGNNGDFPLCTTLPTSFGPVKTDCGPENPANTGAYGNEPGNADIPAVEFNVVGGIASALSPGGPSQPINIAITNPNTGSVHVGTVETTITGTTGGNPSCSAANPLTASPTPWYQLSPPKAASNGLVSDLTVNQNVPPGTTLFLYTGTSIAMIDSNTNQDACENAGVNLSFTSN